MCTHTKWFDNSNSVREVRSLHLGKRHGLCFEWYPDGTLLEESTWQHGVKHGVTQRWYENGERQSQSQWDCGQLSGESLKWWSNGNLLESMHYDAGRGPVGMLQQWHPDGKLKIRVEYADDGRVISLWRCV